jgi:hypothetical protein
MYLMSIMFRLLPVNGHDMNKRSMDIKKRRIKSKNFSPKLSWEHGVFRLFMYSYNITEPA